MTLLQKISNLRAAWTAGFSTKFALAAALLILLSSIGFVGFHYLAKSMLDLDGWQAAMAAAAASLALIVAGLLAERPGFLKTVLHLAVFVAGLVVASLANKALGAFGYAIVGWQLWLIYTGLYAAVLLLAPHSNAAITRRMKDRTRKLALVRRERFEDMQQESFAWKRAMTRVTAVTFIGSCATTAIGFYDAVVEKHDPMWMKLGISIGLSVLAAYIIWTGWEFALKAMQKAPTLGKRLLGFTIATTLLVPMTFAIHTVFGIIGVGGVEGQKAQAMDRLRMLTAHYAIADQKRQVIVTKLLPELERTQKNFAEKAKSEENGSSEFKCGAGKGNLHAYYNARSIEAQNAMLNIQGIKTLNAELPAELEAITTMIHAPDKHFRDVMPDLEKKFATIRQKVLDLATAADVSALAGMVRETKAMTEAQDFATNWSPCQQRQQAFIIAQIKAIIANFEGAMTSAHATIADIDRGRNEIAAERQLIALSVPRFDKSIGITTAKANEVQIATHASEAKQSTTVLPAFQRMRPFDAVVAYWDQLLGYVALQLALDLSPAILGFLFAVLAPLPRKRKERMA